MLEDFGVAETGPVIAINSAMHAMLGTVGRLMTSMEYRLERAQGLDRGGRLFVRHSSDEPFGARDPLTRLRLQHHAADLLPRATGRTSRFVDNLFPYRSTRVIGPSTARERSAMTERAPTTIRLFLFALIAACLISLILNPARAAETLRLDFAYYNPASLVLKQKRWLEEALAPKGIEVTWTLSQGSNKALEFLNAGSLDIGSTAAAASLIGRANGNPVKLVYVYSRPEWTALVTRGQNPIQAVSDLKGKRVAVTRGTDPFIFLLRALSANGLSDKDVTLVPLQHADGRLALDRGDVDAWAGLDPMMAQAELESGDRIFYRNRAFVSAGVLNVREDFAAKHPELVAAVIEGYERARRHALQHPAELKAILAAAARINPGVADRQIERTDLSRPRLGPEVRDSILAAGDVLKAAGVIKPDVDVPAVVGALIDERFAQRLASN